MAEYENIKVGRNKPCPCGEKKPDGSSMKYKNCCLKKDKKPVRITLSRKDFITNPYTDCPNCKQGTFGVFFSAGGGNSFGKECTECGHTAEFQLPEIKKRIVYLDQFVLDNIVKALDPKHPKHEVVLKNQFWLELYKKLEVATRSQLIVCPDSFFHREESGPTRYFEALQRIYEHFSGGATFYDYDHIMQQQIYEHFGNYLKGHSETEPTTEPEKIVHGNLNEWHGKMRISFNKKPSDEEIAEIRKSKTETYQRFLEVFERWKTEKHKKFDEWYWEETWGFVAGTLKVIQKHLQRRATLPEKIARGEELSLNDLLPPASMGLIQTMQLSARVAGLKDESEIMCKIGEYFVSKTLDHVPAVRIGSLLYAALADQAAHGRTKLPSQGVVVDVNMISSLLPYCEAIFVDKENAALLRDNRVKSKLRCNTRIFSLRNKEEFLQYLDEVIASASAEHTAHLNNYYGTSWQEPYMTILDEK